MNAFTHPVKPDSILFIDRAGGDLSLRGWSRQEIRVPEHISPDAIQKKGNKITLTLPEDALLDIPFDLAVRIKQVNGDVVIKNHHQSADLEKVSGDLFLQNAGTLNIEDLQGDLTARRLEGDLVVKSLSGDGYIHQVAGQVSLSCRGDLTLHDISRGVDANASGDLSAAITPLPWQIYQLVAGGDLKLTLPPQVSFQAELESTGKEIRIAYGDLQETIRSGKHAIQVGSEGAAVKLTAGGSILMQEGHPDSQPGFFSLGPGLQNLDQLIRDFSDVTLDQIDHQLASLEKEIQQGLSRLSATLDSYGLNEEYLGRVKEDIRNTSQRAAQKAEIAAQRAEQKINQNIARAQKRAREFQNQNRPFNLETFLFGKENQDDPENEERLLILQMLEDQKISAEQAAELIAALEKKDE